MSSPQTVAPRAPAAQSRARGRYGAAAVATLSRLGLGRFELGVAAVLTLLASAMLLDTAQLSLRIGGTIWGSDTPVVPDTAQYLALVWDSSRDLLTGNPFDGVPDRGITVHPGWVATGTLHALGVPVAIALLVFKPISIALVFIGAHLYTRRLVTAPTTRRIALVLSLFLLSPVAAAMLLADAAQGTVSLPGTTARSLISMARELYPLGQLWGYYWAAISIGLMPLALLAYERAGAPGAPRRWLAIAAVATMFAAWLHPWQGATVILVVCAAELVRRRRPPWRELMRRLVPYLALAGAPLMYLFLLGEFDTESRQLAALLDGGFWPPEVIAACLIPVVVPALLAYRVPARDFQQRAVRWWLPVALFVYVQPAGTFRNHAVEGLTLPLAVLMVIGVASVPWARLRPLRSPRARCSAALTCVVLLCLPALGAQLWLLHDSVTQLNGPLLDAGERRALAALADDPRSGSVLAPLPMAVLVPGLGHREVWSSGWAWTPSWKSRSIDVQALFEGRLAPPSARALVRESGVAFLLSDCGTRTDLRRTLGPLVSGVRDEGCARIYSVRR